MFYCLINQTLDKICAYLKLLLNSLSYKKASQNTAASCANGTTKPETKVTSYGTGLSKKLIIPGHKNVSHNSLVPIENSYSSSLHVKLGLMKQFVKTMNKTGDLFYFLKIKYSHPIYANIKERISVVFQNRQLFNDLMFTKHLNPKEKRLWLAFRSVRVNLFGDEKSDDYVTHVEKSLSAYKAMRCNMSLKAYFFPSYLELFPENLEAISDEHIGNSSIKTSFSSRGNFWGSGMLTFWQNVVGQWWEKLLLQGTRGNQVPDENTLL